MLRDGINVSSDRTDLGRPHLKSHLKMKMYLQPQQLCYKIRNGEMAEWSIAAVLKTVEGQPSQGSNPCLSATV